MRKTTPLLAFAVICGHLQGQVAVPLAGETVEFAADGADSPNPIIEWNKTLLTIVSTPGQPATIPSPRNFAMLHVAMFDAVNNLVAGFVPYLVRQSNEPRSASPTAATDQAAHDALVALYPDFQPPLDWQPQGHRRVAFPDAEILETRVGLVSPTEDFAAAIGL